MSGIRQTHFNCHAIGRNAEKTRVSLISTPEQHIAEALTRYAAGPLPTLPRELLLVCVPVRYSLVLRRNQAIKNSINGSAISMPTAGRLLFQCLAQFQHLSGVSDAYTRSEFPLVVISTIRRVSIQCFNCVAVSLTYRRNPCLPCISPNGMAIEIWWVDAGNHRLTKSRRKRKEC